jgi:hypothetical protein
MSRLIPMMRPRSLLRSLSTIAVFAIERKFRITRRFFAMCLLASRIAKLIAIHFSSIVPSEIHRLAGREFLRAQLKF